MKKRIIAMVLVAVLVGGGLGGLVYAQGTHEPMTGQKLVGVGPCGFWVPVPYVENHANTLFRITNPDCVAEIKIERVSIIKNEPYEVIYEGPLLLDGTEVTELEPHQVGLINLALYVEGGWDTSLALYTVEVFWKGKKDGLPLIGWGIEHTKITYSFPPDQFQVTDSTSTFQMVNMKQELK